MALYYADRLMRYVDGTLTGGSVLATEIRQAWGPERKPNKARFKAAVVGCIRASGEEELEMWCELLRDEIALFQELENPQKDDRDEIAAFFGETAKEDFYGREMLRDNHCS